jgi:hypothetical protein
MLSARTPAQTIFGIAFVEKLEVGQGGQPVFRARGLSLPWRRSASALSANVREPAPIDPARRRLDETQIVLDPRYNPASAQPERPTRAKRRRYAFRRAAPPTTPETVYADAERFLEPLSVNVLSQSSLPDAVLVSEKSAESLRGAK